jgi:hypothetical protein
MDFLAYIGFVLVQELMNLELSMIKELRINRHVLNSSLFVLFSFRSCENVYINKI